MIAGTGTMPGAPLRTRLTEYYSCRGLSRFHGGGCTFLAVTVLRREEDGYVPVGRREPAGDGLRTVKMARPLR